VLIDWDSITLRNIPDAVIIECEEKGLSWSQMYLHPHEVECIPPRDTLVDVKQVIDEIADRHRWCFLGEEGLAIQAVLANVDPDDEWGAFEAWARHLCKVLRFPFIAVVAEFQERGPIEAGQRVIVKRVVGIADPHGVLVEMKHKRGTFTFPLCDLRVAGDDVSLHDHVQEYAVWFANR